MIKRICVIHLFIIFNIFTYGQTGFKKTFNYTLWDGAVSVDYNLKNNEALICGFGYNNIKGENITSLLKLGFNGHLKWDTVIKDYQSILPTIIDISTTSKGNFSYLFGNGHYDNYPCLIKLDVDNNRILFNKSYNMGQGKSGGFMDLFIDDSTNELTAFGYGSPKFDPNQHDSIISKLDSNGNLNNLIFIARDSVDKIYRYTFKSNIPNHYDIFQEDANRSCFYFTRVDNIGNKIFAKKPLQNALAYYNCTIQKPNGEYVVFAEVKYTPFNERTNVAIVLSPEGDSISMHQIGRDQNSFVFGNVDNSGNILLSSRNSLLKLDTNYKEIWWKILDSNLNSVCQISPDVNDEIWVVGTMTYPDLFSDSLNYMDMVVYKLSKNGEFNSIEKFGTNHALEKIKIFPNPTSEKLNTNILEVFNYEIYNLASEVLSRGISSGQVDVSFLNQGIYFIKIEFKEINTTYKFIKQ